MIIREEDCNVTEGLVGLSALAALGLIFALRDAEPIAPAAAPPETRPLRPFPIPLPEPLEAGPLDDTRYSAYPPNPKGLGDP